MYLLTTGRFSKKKTNKGLTDTCKQKINKFFLLSVFKFFFMKYCTNVKATLHLFPISRKGTLKWVSCFSSLGNRFFYCGYECV